MKDKIQILKLELRFLSTFLKYTVNRSAWYEDLFNRIEDVGRNINKLVSSSRESVVDGAIRDLLDEIRLIKPEMGRVQMKVLRSSGRQIIEIETDGCGEASGLNSFVRYELVGEFIATLEEDLEELVACEADFLQPSLKDGLQILKRKLKFLKGLIGFTAKRCREDDKLYQLFTHVQAVADNAAYLAYTCLINEMDEERGRNLERELSNLVQNIDPANPVVREIYTLVIKGSKPSDLGSSAYVTDETAVDFVDSLLESTRELLYRDIIPLKDQIDQIEILHVELTSLKYFLKDAHRASLGNSNYLLVEAEVLAIESGAVIHSLFQGAVNQDIAQKMCLALSKLLDRFRIAKKLVRERYLKVEKASISNFPKTDELGVLGFLVQNLKELLNDRDDSVTLLEDHIQIIQKDMEFLRSFMATTEKRRHEHEIRDDLWWRIVRVTYEIEYAIDSAVVNDGPILHHMLWLSDLIEEIKLIKKEINELLISDGNIHGLQEDNVATSTGFELPQFNAPRFDEEMIGFKDEVSKVLEQLVGEPKSLLIVSIVGMPGLGKTFLAHKVYNDALIKEYFFVRAWCSISQAYERKELLINILSQVKRSSNDMSEMTDEDLARMSYQSLKGQRYLIVLDDIWDIGPWNDLRRSFPNDHNGSRIVFTSRSSKLASQANTRSIVHRLQQFSHEESWELLRKKIFKTQSCPEELLYIGLEIAKSCNGLPLAVVVVAGVLAKIGNEQERWRRVANSLSSYIIGDQQKQWMHILDLSYKNLPDYLKPCLLYFGGFPEDKQIPVVKLTQLWIAERFVQGNQPSLEKVAENYLIDLIDRSLIIASGRRSRGGVKTCLIHDLIRNFCVSKAKEENFLQLIEGCGDLLTSFSTSHTVLPSSSSTSYEQRRLFVHHRQNKKIWSKSSGPCVRSLLFFAPGRKSLPLDEVSSICQGFRLLKILDLMHINVGPIFPEGIELLALLKYLALSGNFSSIPPSITNFRKLESFLVKAIRLLSLPSNILYLTKLCHLHINARMSLVKLSSEDPSQMECLQTLSRPILSYGDDMDKMRRFPNLRKLSCVFKESWDSSTSCNRLPILDFLSQLESLKVTYLGQMRHPCKFNFPSNVKKLTMSGFRLRWQQISIVGNLPNLEVLKLLDEAFEGEEWNVQDGEFPKLKFLKLEDMSFRKWIAYDDWSPPLEQMILEGCHQLQDFPSCLGDIPTLSMILVEDCSDASVDAVLRIQREGSEWGNDIKIEIRRRRD